MKSLFHMPAQILSLLFLGTCLFFTTADAASSISKEDILDTLEKKYAGKSFEADFTQLSKLAALDITETASGKAFFSHPGKMKWKYLAPEHNEIITNGKELWIFRPEENQVMQGTASSFFKTGSGGAFLSDISLVRKNYGISIKEVTADYVEMDLVAKKENPDISSIVIRVSLKKNEIIRVITYSPYDDTTLFDFTNIRFKKIDPDVFDFKPPEGSNIIKLN